MKSFPSQVHWSRLFSNGILTIPMSFSDITCARVSGTPKNWISGEWRLKCENLLWNIYNRENQTVHLSNNETVYQWMTIYTLPRSHWGGWALEWRNTTFATRVMQSSSNELRILAPDCAECKWIKFDTYALIPELTLSHRFGLGVCHQPDIKLRGFQSQFWASYVSSHTEELWYNETVCLWMKTHIYYIYIYIYIYIVYQLTINIKELWFLGFVRVNV